MINVSNAFKRELYEGHRNYLEYVDITLSNGRMLNLTNNELWQGGLLIDDAVSSENTFDLGAAIINKCSVTINNIYEDFSPYDFSDARVVAYVGLEFPDGRKERVRKGTFAVDEAKYNGSIITLSCLDNMKKFDKAYSMSVLRYPATLERIILDACSMCDVVLQTYNFPHSDVEIQEHPDGEATTFREVISWVAQIAGCFCRCDVYGRLELKWYDQEALEIANLDGGLFDTASPAIYTSGDNADGGTFSPWNTGYEYDGGTFEELAGVHHIFSRYSMDISVDDVVITGVRVLEKTKEEEQEAIRTYQSGTSGYVISIENNDLIKGGLGQQVVGWLGEQLIGLRFRRANVTHPSDPTMEAGDVGFLTDLKGNTYRIVISSTRFSTGASQTTISSAENPARNSADRFSAETKNYVEYRKNIEKERTEREKELDNLKLRMDESPGLFTTEETLPDGGKVFYMHNKPTLSESDIVWKMTAEAWGVSTDGGKTYNAGMTVDGDVITRILRAVGINADWINAGEISANLIKSGVLDGITIKSDYRYESTSGDASVDIGVLIEKGSMYIVRYFTQSGKRGRVVLGRIGPTYEEGTNSDGTSYVNYRFRIAAGMGLYDIGEEGAYRDMGNFQLGRNIQVADQANGYSRLTVNGDLYQGELGSISTLTVLGNFKVYGAKNRVAKTSNYGERLQYSYEMPSPMFGDIGEAETDDSGKCYIYLDDIFSETITPEIEYQVFLQKEGAGDIWVDEKTPVYFKVKGTENLKFAWEIKAKQKDYEYERLDTPQENEGGGTDYEEEYLREIDQLIREQEELLYETA